MIIDPSQVQQSAPSLPLWMQISAFVVSLGLAALKIVGFFRRPTLYVHVTRDVFFRLIDAGEALFCSAVLLAGEGPVLVRNIEPVLKRISGVSGRQAEKQFPLLVMQHGEKVPGSQVNADHKFFGSSPLQYLPVSTPFRAIYVCLQKEYEARQKKAINAFPKAVAAFRDANSDSAEDRAEDLRRQFSEIIETQYNSMVPLIQLESGNYQLELHVDYECVGWRFVGARRKTISRLTFSVDDQLLGRLCTSSATTA